MVNGTGNGSYTTVIDVANNTCTMNLSNSFTVGGITFTRTSTTLAMNKSGTIYYYGESSTQQIVAPTVLQYTANTVLTSNLNVRLGVFTFVPD